MKGKILIVVASTLFAVTASAALGRIRAEPFSWFQGDTYSYVAGIDRPGLDGNPSGDLNIYAANDINVGSHHLRLEAADGNYEFEHSQAVPYTRLNSYYIGGVGVRTPIIVGGNDGQDVLSFIVTGRAGQKNDLQQWTPGDKVAAAIDSRGRLRLGQVTIAAQIRQGRATLVAILPSGERQVLAAGRRSG